MVYCQHNDTSYGIEITIYDKFEESLLFHSLDFELEMTQPWGEIDFDIETIHRRLSAIQ